MLTPTGQQKIEKRFLSVREAASLLSVDRREIYRMIKSGEIKAIRRPGKLTIEIKELERWIEKHNVTRPVKRRKLF